MNNFQYSNSLTCTIVVAVIAHKSSWYSVIISIVTVCIWTTHLQTNTHAHLYNKAIDKHGSSRCMERVARFECELNALSFVSIGVRFVGFIFLFYRSFIIAWKCMYVAMTRILNTHSTQAQTQTHKHTYVHLHTCAIVFELRLKRDLMSQVIQFD